MSTSIHLLSILLALTQIKNNVSQAPKRVVSVVHVAHHVPGRMRLKVLGVPADPDFFSSLKQVISGLEGVESVRVNASSSSIVIDYSPADTVFHFRLRDDPNVNAWMSLQGEDALLASIDVAVANGSYYLAKQSRLAEGLVAGAEELDFRLRRASDGYVDLKLLLPLLFAVATSMRQARGTGTPMWLSLGTFAFNSFLSLHRERIGAPVIKIISTGLSRARSKK